MRGTAGLSCERAPCGRGREPLTAEFKQGAGVWYRIKDQEVTIERYWLGSLDGELSREADVLTAVSKWGSGLPDDRENPSHRAILNALLEGEEDKWRREA